MLSFYQLIQLFLLFFVYSVRPRKHLSKCDVNRCSFRGEREISYPTSFDENLVVIYVGCLVSFERCSVFGLILTI